MTSDPPPQELAAIAVAVTLATRVTYERAAAPAAWTLAMRSPELELDDVRSIACRAPTLRVR